jgi:eukaryotic-like serine/threonine-protein kinase
MDHSGADRNLLFGLVALQNGLIDQAQLVAAFQAWTLDKGRPIADHLVGRGELDAADRSVVEALVARHLKKHGGDAAKSLAALPAAVSAKRSLGRLADSELAQSLAGLPGVEPFLETQDNLTFQIDPGLTAPGGSVLHRLGAGMGTIVSHVVLHETEPADRSMATHGGNGERLPHARAGRYELLGEIARGGMGSVIRGRDVDLGRDLALKVLLDEHRNRSELVDRFVEEAQICGQLQHPGVVPVYELGALTDHRPFFTMKLVKGQTLAALLAGRSSPADDLPRFLSIFEAICQTVAYAHSRGVIHRDLKPSNVMVGSFGEVQVMDWGLAKVLPRDGEKKDNVPAPADETIVATLRSSGESELSQAGSALGTPAYMPPEQARGELESVDRRADVFSLGAILCEILTGKPPFSGGTAMEVLRAAGRADLGDAPARLESCGAEEELLALARACLAVEARDRPADAGVVAGRMTAYLAGVQDRLREAELSRAAESARAIEAEAKVSAERRARRLTAALAATVLLAGVLGGAGWRWVELQRIERVGEASGRVNVALRDATRLRGLAQGAAVGDLGPWELAAVAAEKARDLMEPGVEPALRKQVDDLRAEVAAERNEAEAAGQAADRDRRLMGRLVDIRSAEADDPGGWNTDAAYADAFREAGLDVSALSAEEAAKRIRARPPEVATALAIAVDDWAASRRDRKKDRIGAAALSALAGAADPDAWRLDLRRALDLPDRSARTEALRRLAKATPFESMGPISLDLLGRALKDAGDPAGAEAVLRRAQQLHPGDVWINYDLARALEKLARREEAIRYYTAARSIRPETAHELAHALGAKGERDGEIAIFEDLRRLRPSSGRHLGCLSRALRDQGRVPEADTILEAATAANREGVRRSPDDASAHLSLGFTLIKQGKTDEAIAEYRTAIRLRPDDATSHDNLCEALCLQGKMDEAIAEARAAIRIQPDFANAHNTLGHVLYQLKQDYRAAAVEFREAVRLQDDNAVYRKNLGLALQQQGELDGAIGEYKVALRLLPDFVDVHMGLGEIFEFQGKRDDAIVAYRTASRIRPNFADAHNYLAWVMAKKSDCSDRERAEALEHARLAVSLSPEDGGIQNTLSLAEYRAGHWAESIAAARRSIALAKDADASNGFFLAMAVWQQGDLDRARSHFDEAVSLAEKADPRRIELVAFWREAAGLLGQPGPTAGAPTPHRPD